MALISPRKQAESLPNTASPAEGEADAGHKAKRISRPAHWKEAFQAPIAPRAARTTAPAPQETLAEPTSLPLLAREWRDDSGFLLRVLALVAIVNIMLFVLFPLSGRDHSMASETYTPIQNTIALPAPKARPKAPITFYAPSPREETRAKPAAPAPNDALDAPRWLGQ